MFFNYLKIAFRNLRREPLISGLNVLGLALGLGFSIWVAMFFKHEWEYDSFVPEHDQLVHAYLEFNSIVLLSNIPTALGPEAKAKFPEVIDFLRLVEGKSTLKVGEELYRESLVYADTNFFEFYPLELVYGHPKNAFASDQHIVVSEAYAERFFGKDNPVGKEIEIYVEGEFVPFQVGAVLAPLPSQSNFDFELLLPLRNYYLGEDAADMNTWGHQETSLVLKTRKGVEFAALQQKLQDFYTVNRPVSNAPVQIGTNTRTLFLASGSQLHMRDVHDLAGMKPVSNPRYLFIMMGISLIVLLIACFNFANLNNAQLSRRFKEIGVRKVIGAVRKQLLFQFWLESVLMSFIAAVLGLILADLSLPLWQQMLDVELSSLLWQDAMVIPILILFALITGSLAGIYPAWMIARLKVVDSFRKHFTIGGNNWLTYGSILIQFSLSIALIMCTLIMHRQNQFMLKKDLGFKSEQMLVVNMGKNEFDELSGERIYQKFRQKLVQHPQIKGISAASYMPMNGISIIPLTRTIDGKPKMEPVFDYRVAEGFLELTEIELKAGRMINDTSRWDRTHGIIVNETLLKEFELAEEEILGKKFPYHLIDEDNVVLGVVKDIHFMDLKADIEPMVFHMHENWDLREVAIKVAPEDFASTLAYVEAAWREVAPNKFFQYYFMDDVIAERYVKEQKWQKGLFYAAAMAIFIACFGLFGLTALAAVRRTKELGIRKVLGASTWDVVYLLSRQFLWMVVGAIVIATPITLWVMNEWLSNFKYRIEMSAWMFVLAGVLAVGIAVATVGLRALRAAGQNPVESLRYE